MGLQPDFPFTRGDTRGYFRFLPQEATIKGRLILLLCTNPGERPFLCDYGVGLKKFLFEPLDDTTLRQIRTKIVQQMGRWEPNISVLNIAIDVTDYGPPAAIMINMKLELKPTKDRQTLSFPIGV